jgi:hypothetical protein
VLWRATLGGDNVVIAAKNSHIAAAYNEANRSELSTKDLVSKDTLFLPVKSCTWIQHSTKVTYLSTWFVQFVRCRSGAPRGCDSHPCETGLISELWVFWVRVPSDHQTVVIPAVSKMSSKSRQLNSPFVVLNCELPHSSRLGTLFSSALGGFSQ